MPLKLILPSLIFAWNNDFRTLTFQNAWPTFFFPSSSSTSPFIFVLLFLIQLQQTKLSFLCLTLSKLNCLYCRLGQIGFGRSTCVCYFFGLPSDSINRLAHLISTIKSRLVSHSFSFSSFSFSTFFWFEIVSKKYCPLFLSDSNEFYWRSGSSFFSFFLCSFCSICILNN